MVFFILGGGARAEHKRFDRRNAGDNGDDHHDERGGNQIAYKLTFHEFLLEVRRGGLFLDVPREFPDASRVKCAPKISYI